MKKWSGFIIFLVLFVLAQAAHATTIRINDFDLVDVKDGSFEVKIEDVANLGAFQFDLRYDSSVVTIDKITLGNFLGSTGRTVWDPVFSEIGSGKLTFGAFTQGAAEGPVGNGTLATIDFTLNKEEFDKLAEGFTTLDFDEIRSYITDTSGTLLSEYDSWTDGKITNTCTVNASAGTGGSIEPSGDVLAECGTNVTFTITQEDCYTAKEIVVNDAPPVAAAGSYTFTDVQGEDNRIAVSFDPKPPCTVTTNPGENGSISPSGPVTVACGASQDFTVTPDDCYDIVGGVSSYPFTCSNGGDTKEITADFVMRQYTITSSAGPEGSISPSGPQTVPCGSNADFTMTSNAGYEIRDVLVDGVSVGPVSSYPFTNVRADHTIHVTFSDRVFIIDAKKSGDCGGKIEPSGKVAVDYGQNTTFEMTPDACCKISDVLVDGVSVGAVNSYEFKNVNQDHSIEAIFTILKYVITPDQNEGGKISSVGGITPLPSGDVEVKCGMGQTFNITPDAGYKVKDVLADGESVGPVSSHTFMDVGEDHTLEAQFEKENSLIKISWDCPGHIELPSDVILDNFSEVPVPYGESQEFVFVADEGYHVGEVWINGQKKPAAVSDSKYTFENVMEAQTQRLHVVFVDDESNECSSFTIAATASDGGKIEPAEETIVSYGGKATFTITPDTDYEICDVVVDGEPQGQISEYVFSNIFSDHTIHAEFAEETFEITASAGKGGSISPSEIVTVCKGSEKIFTITPDACYKVKDVIVDGESEGPVMQHIFSDISGDHTIEVSFEDVAITTSAGCGGSISPSVDVECKDTDKLVITPEESYEICDVLVNGESQGAIAEYSLAETTGDLIISASFSNIGDVNSDCDIGLEDAILALKLIAGEENIETISLCADVSGDGKIGLEEAVYVLQVIAD